MELDRSSVIDRLQSRITTIEDFNFDKLSAPPLYSLVSPEDIDKLYKIAHSVRYSGNPAKKYRMIDDVLRPRGFIKLSAGTNRVVYKHTELDFIVLKVAYDDIGLKDNPREFYNQHIFKPFVTKVFEVSPCGTVAVVERVIPITSREEFESVADDIYVAITSWFIGKYIMADIGTNFFMNWAIRRGFGVVLLDFPYCYELDGNKLYCSAPINNNQAICDGVIDYDDGFNFLVCEKCGTRYRVNELGKTIHNKNIIIKGRRKPKMKVVVKRNDTTVSVSDPNELGFKPETPNVVAESKGTSVPSGTLKVSTQYVNTQPKKKQKSVSVNMKSSGKGNNRGTVRSNNESKSTMKVSTSRTSRNKEVNETSKIEKQPDLHLEFSSYDNENKQLVLRLYDRNGVKETELFEISVDEVPVDYLDAVIESSATAEELANALRDLNASEERCISLEKEVSEAKEVIASKDANIEEYERKIVELEDKLDDSPVDKLKKKIAELEKQLENKSEDENESPDVKLLDQKNAEIKSLEKDKTDLLKSIDKMTEQLTSITEELNSDKVKHEKAIKEKDSMIKKMKDQLADKDAKISALEDMLKEANEKLEASGSSEKFKLGLFDWDKDINIFSLFEKLDIGVSYIQGKVVAISELVSDESKSNVPEDMLNRHIIIFPTGDGDENFTDQNQNIISVISINGSTIDEIMEAPDPTSVEEIEMVEAPVGSVQQ